MNEWKFSTVMYVCQYSKCTGGTGQFMKAISSVTDCPRPGHAHPVVTREGTAAVEAIVKENRRVTVNEDGFGGLVVSMLASGTREFAGSNPAEFVGFFGNLKNPPHAFLRRVSERICPMSQLCGM